jgi:hypothetical protein
MLLLLLPSLPPSPSSSFAAAATDNEPSPAPSIPQANCLPEAHGDISVFINRGQSEGGRERGREGEAGEDLAFACVEDFDGPVFGRRVELVCTRGERRPF